MSPPTSVLMLTNAVAPDKLGGLERYVRELSAALVSLGLPVTVLTKRISDDDPQEETGSDGVRILRHSVPDKGRRTFALQYPFYVSTGIIRQLLSRVPGSVVHCHYPITSLPLIFTSLPYLYTFHAPVHKEVLVERGNSYALPRSVQRSAVAGMRVAERLVTSGARETVVLSEFMRSQLRELSPSAGNRTQLIAGGIDTDHFSPGPAKRPPWALFANPLLFSARRLTLRTGVLELVQAMPAVLERWPGARLVIAGEGHQRDTIAEYIRLSGLEGRAALLGRIGDPELRNWYRIADLTVTPSQELEGFGLSTAESLAVGTPALVTPGGANPEVVRDLHPLLVASGCRSEDLAASICRVLEEPGLLGTLRSTARSQVHPRWSWTAVAKQYLGLYQAVGT
jgi:glycosyltransferase involved in cell wall biosynthesis